MKQIYKVISIFVILMLATTMASAVIYAPPQPAITGTPSGFGGGIVPSVTVQTDKTTYYLGDPVTITVKNNLNQPIHFYDIMVKNMATNEVFGVSWCPQIPGVIVACAAVAPIGPMTLDSGQTYVITWYPSNKGIYKSYVDWWTDAGVSCLSTDCPPPPPGISGTTYSKYFWVR